MVGRGSKLGSSSPHSGLWGFTPHIKERQQCKGEKKVKEEERRRRRQNIWTGQNWHLTGHMITGFMCGAVLFHSCIVFCPEVPRR